MTGIRFGESCGIVRIHGGVLANSAEAEALTSLPIFINKTYEVDDAAVRITGTLVGVD